MKPGMEIGQTSEIRIRVTPDMFAQFEGNVIHEAYSTVSMVYHMEWAARQIILPYLEDHEEGIGGAVAVKHIAPSAVHSIVHIRATLTDLKDNIVVTKTEAWNEIGMIGEGEVTQVILPKGRIMDKLAKSKKKEESQS